MNGRVCLFCCVLFLGLPAGSAATQEKTVFRFVEFRDGTVLRLPVVNEPWKVSQILPDGQIKSVSILPADIQALSLTPEQDFDKKRKLLSFVLQLGAEDFWEREAAWQKIFKMGPSICPDLKACLHLTEDVEIRARLHDLIHKLHPDDPRLVKSRIVFDQFEAPGHFWGYLEDLPIRIMIKGQQYPLQRKDVASVSLVPPGMVQRVPEKDFPPDSIEEYFESNPATGQKLKENDNAEKLFVGKGFLLSTAVPNSFVSINNFTVAGISRGMSVANHEPRFAGEIIIHFCQPGKEHIPAAVDYFGCYVAQVEPNGTEMIAYDLQDRVLGKIATRERGTDFLGIRSLIPIHKIRIVPTDLDVDFTLDDFIFRFADTTQASHPNRILAELLAGDTILCQDVSLKGDQITLHGLPAGLPDLTLPIGELARVNPAQTPKVQKKEGLFAQLADGSILFAPEQSDSRKRPVFERIPDLLEPRKDLKPRKDLVGVWTTKSGRKLPESKTKGMVVWDSEHQQWKGIDFLQFLELLVLWRNIDSSKENKNPLDAVGYEKFTTVWLHPPRSVPEPGSWHVQTVTGEDLVLAKDQPFTGKLSEGVAVTWRGQELHLPVSQIMSIYQVPPKK